MDAAVERRVNEAFDGFAAALGRLSACVLAMAEVFEQAGFGAVDAAGDAAGRSVVIAAPEDFDWAGFVERFGGESLGLPVAGLPVAGSPLAGAGDPYDGTLPTDRYGRGLERR